MAISKRVLLFLGVNFLIIITISVIVNIFNLGPYLNSYGLDLPALIIFSLIWGMAGALISLAVSRMVAKWSMGVKVIDPRSSNPQERRLLDMVRELCGAADLQVMPEVGFYESSELNAFATGPTKARSLVAVSTGLINKMDSAETKAVLGHEVAHIANGDMVTMTLLQGIVNAFSIFLSRIIAYLVAQTLRERGQGGISYVVYFAVSLVLQIVFLILGSILIAWFSRHREYRADLGGAKLAGRENMINALKVLEQTYETVGENRQASISNLKISGKGSGIFRLFSTHPSLKDRIERLRRLT